MFNLLSKSTTKIYYQNLLPKSTIKIYNQNLLSKSTTRIYYRYLLPESTIKIYYQNLLSKSTTRIYYHNLLPESTTRIYYQQCYYQKKVQWSLKCTKKLKMYLQNEMIQTVYKEIHHLYDSASIYHRKIHSNYKINCETCQAINRRDAR